jgi:clan AA aspartic protease (TIGR02281 family)
MRNNIPTLFLLFLLMSGAWAGTIYKCRGPQGELVYQEAPCRDAQALKSWSAKSAEPQADDAAAESGANGVLVIPQRGSGHYFVNGSVNGKALTFVVDTGASSVVLPRPVAMLAGVYCKDKVLMQTVGGTASGCAGVAARLKFGPFLIRDVPVMIAPDLSQPLLGMNVLQQFRIEQDNGEMRLSPRN